MFRRRRQGEEPEESLELTDEQTEEVAGEGAAPGRDGGPWDSAQAFPERRPTARNTKPYCVSLNCNPNKRSTIQTMTIII